MSETIFSFGGGVQSVASLVLATRKELPITQFVFANVGDDSENPATIRYLQQYVYPYARAHGLVITEVARTFRDGRRETLLENITRPGGRSIPIPVRLSNGAPGRRACTASWKILPIAKWLKQRGATSRDPAQVALGISLDEYLRMKDSQVPHVRNSYPLVDRQITRNDCQNIIQDAGLPPVPKSSCWFCPYHRMRVWQEMARDEPTQFQQAVELEQHINTKRATLGRDLVYMTDRLVPLDRAVGQYVMGNLWDEAEAPCDSGHCFT